MSDSDIYACGRCGVYGIKLWREAHTMQPELLCVECLHVRLVGSRRAFHVEEIAENGTHLSDIDGRPTDQIEWWLPAVQVLEDQPELRFWGYTSTPEKDYQHWRDLPLRWRETRDG